MNARLDPEGLAAWDRWVGPSKKSVDTGGVTGLVPTGCFPARGWAGIGLPPDAGDGMAWNREGWLGQIPAEKAVLQLSTVWACVRLLAEVMSTLPCGVYKTQNGVHVPDESARLFTLLHDQPNQDQTAVEFWQVNFSWMLLRGAAYVEKDILGNDLIGLSPLFRPALTWTWENGVRNYRYVDPFTGRSRPILTDRIWRIPAFNLGGREDMSPIALGARMFAGALAADGASQRVFESGMMASGFATMPDGVWLKEEQRKDMKSSLDEFRGASRAGGVFVLEGGATYQALSMNPEDAQMLETRGFNVEEICRWFRVPPSLVGHGDKTSNWGTGLEQQDLAFLKYSLRTWLKRVETSARMNLMTPAEKSSGGGVEFNVEALLRTDSASRATFYNAMTQAGIYTRDYCRGLENLAPMGGNAAKLMVQSQNVPIDKIGEWTADPSGRQLVALQSIMEAVTAGRLPADAARSAIQAAIPILTPAQVDAILSPIDDFEAMPGQTDPAAATPTPTGGHGSSTAAADAGAVQSTALNGAQVTALQGILLAAASGELPIETARAAIRAAFPLLSNEEITAMITPLVNFVPPTPPPSAPGVPSNVPSPPIAA